MDCVDEFIVLTPTPVFAELPEDGTPALDAEDAPEVVDNTSVDEDPEAAEDVLIEIIFVVSCTFSVKERDREREKRRAERALLPMQHRLCYAMLRYAVPESLALLSCWLLSLSQNGGSAMNDAHAQILRTTRVREN